MKTRMISIFLLCLFLTGCSHSENQTEVSTEAAQVETSTESVTAAVIKPLPDTTMEARDNSVLNIAFGQDDFYCNESGDIVLRMQIYSYEKFDMVDISCLEAGNIILVSGEEVPVNAISRNDYGTVLVNGGLDEGGFDLATDDNGIYYVQGYSDMKSWNMVGKAECLVSDDFVFTDRVDLEQGDVSYTAGELLEGLPGVEYGYQPQNTTVRIENGFVVAMERIYTP